MKAYLFIYLAIFHFTVNAHAEYRVYQYYVKSTNKFSMDTKAHMITTSMGPSTYVAYHGGSSSIKVDLLRSWMCAGDTSGMKSYCPPPTDIIANGENNKQ